MSVEDSADIRVELVDGLQVAYRSLGSGPRLVLVHGLAQDHQIWSRVQDGFPDYSTMAYDIRGHGRTPLGNGDGTLAQLGNDLVGFLENVGPATCIGFSLGGAIALWAAGERPDLVQKVVAVATSSVVGADAAEALQERIEVLQGGDPTRIWEVLYGDTTAQLGNREVDARSVAEERRAAIRDPAGYVNGARAVLSMRKDSLHDRLAQISAQVLIITGELDRWCPRRAAEIMLEQLKTAHFVELQGAGHLVTHDGPAAFAAALRGWLEAKGGNG